MKLHLALAGFGNVARRFVRLLREREAELAALGLEPVIVGIATRTRGTLFSPRGIDAIAFSNAVCAAARCCSLSCNVSAI